MRDANVSISTDEVLSLSNALPHISILDKKTFRQTLQTTLVKDYTDIPVFQKCFDQYFNLTGDAIDENIEKASDEMRSRDAIRESHPGMEEELSRLEEALFDFIDGLPDEILMSKNPHDILKLFLDEMETSGAAGGMGMLLFNMRRSMQSGGTGDGGEGDQEDDGQTEMSSYMMGLLNQKLSKKKIGNQIKDRENYLLNKYIYQITPEEIKEMKELIKRFGQKLKNKISLRKKRVKHGGIDIKRTLRSSLQYGGIPFKIYHKNKKIDRPQLVVLCDVSGSVNQYSRFMLLLTYTLQSLFSKVRTFAFISNIVEITNLFMEMDPELALNSIFSDTDFTYGWGSNYGKCFEIFVKDHSDSLTSKTTVLILGDGRNNYQDPGLNYLIRIKERSRNLFWLNPDKKHLWNWGDSIADLYKNYCDEMKEVNNFLDLSLFIDKLFLD